jgi:hypothetical protein
MQTPFRARLGALSVIGAAVACLAGAGPALAAPCTAQLKDASNASFDLTHPVYYTADGTPSPNPWFVGAGIGDGAVFNSDGTLLADDAYDGGPVFNVLDLDANPAADPAAPAPEDVYPFADADSADGCQMAQDGREMLYPEETVHTDIAMSRRIYVSATGLGGARFVDTVRNTGAAPRHLRLVQGWDGVDYDLGSDSDTAFVAANTAAVGNDTRWIVTDDVQADSTIPGDPALSHVFDGPGSVDTVDAIHLVDGSDAFYVVRDVTLAPGETASFVFYEGMTALPGQPARVAADERAAAAQLAAARFGQSADSLYAGLPAGLVSTVRNWQRPAVTPSIALVGDANDNAPVSLNSSADLGASMCSLASREWTVDGAPAGSDATLTRTYSAGAHALSLKVTSTCGTSGVAAGTLTVAHVGPSPVTTTDPHTPGVTVFRTPAKPVKVAKGKAVLRFSCADADGCSASSFTLTGPKVTVRDKHGKKTTKRAFVLTIKVPATTKAGTPRVTVKLTKAARSAVAKAGKKGAKVTVAPRGAKSGVSFRLVG